MADNSTSSSSNSDDGNNWDTQNLTGLIALIISLIALLGTIAQVLQQYYASATGYTNCNESVIGEWHRSKKRVFRWGELRFEVQFEAPVLFVCPPNNKKGPVKSEAVYIVRGDESSLRETRALLPAEEAKQSAELRKDVHTADNERASWVTLLSELQNMEKESRDWQQKEYSIFPPSSKKQARFEDHGVAVAVQAKRRSWDTMPAQAQKPYATTTICHLLEIAAMLGIYWREFDRSRDKYRAEGNGYILTGSKVSELGIMFTFQLSGKRRFMENRVIPVHEVKELCCGTLSTIFRENRDDRMLELLEESKDLSWLQLGSMNEIAESLVLIGCNTNTANYYRMNDMKNTHLFPVAFELVGMLGKPLHIRNTCFRMVPNPTPCHWDKKFFSLRRMMGELHNRLSDDDVTTQSVRVQRLTNLAGGIERCWRLADGPVLEYDLPLLEALHDALDECDNFLKNSVSRELVTLVMREHFQVVLKMINNPDQAEDSNDDSSESNTGGTPRTRRSHHNRHHHHGSRELRFGDLYAASPEERQSKFMDIYFSVVLPAVVERALKVFVRRRTTTRYVHTRDSSVNSIHSAPASVLLAAMSEKNMDSPLASPSSQPETPQHVLSDSNGSVPRLQVEGVGVDAGVEPLTGADTLETRKVQATNIWCTLVFRMCCWLLLHDFHRKDVQIAKSELLGSRLPVYII